MSAQNQFTEGNFRRCPLCGSNDSISFLQKQEMTLVQCKNCAMIFSNPVPAEMSSGSFYNETHAPFYLSPDKLKSDYASVRFERELRLFRRFCKSGNVLDVGCSTGAFLFQLQNRFPGSYDALGTDVSQPALEYAKSRGVKIVNESFLDFDFGEKHFDAITFWAVMEHLTNPKQFLDKATSLLKRGGHCFILVPNMRSLAVRTLGGKYRYILPEHLNYFTPRTLEKFSKTQTSIEIISSGSSHFNPIVIWQDFRGRGEYVSDENRAALLKRTTAAKQNPLLKPAKWVYKGAEKVLSGMNLADNLLLVLRKK
jgi:2-polyprenyl-3-methyl-5-hydroxy-6-metoxy-1,4-benzoquinol methylase